MLFNSFPFVVFFILFFSLYWFVFSKSLRLQNLLILVGSYVFYGWWDWHFLFLLIAQSSLFFFLGYFINKTERQKTKNILLYIGVIAGIGSLIYYKYANFFISTFINGFAKFNITLNIHTINILLPLGISFYTFRLLTYLFDIHKNKMKPTSDWVVFYSFVAFFPSLLSGPIDRAKSLIPQLEKQRTFNYIDAADAMRQILWGLFKKLVIADNLAQLTNPIFDNFHDQKASSLLIAPFFYTIQLYADFSGYSDMAIGIAKLLGLKTTKNFDFPIFAQNIAEFWRKWHISLTSWLTDYVFSPLNIAFRNYGKAGMILAILINFTLVGIWHGASWGFVLFGLLNGCYYIPLILRGTMGKKNKTNVHNLLPSMRELWNIIKTYSLVSLTFILFRSANPLGYISRIFSRSLFSKPEIFLNLIFVAGITFFIVIEWLGRHQDFATAQLGAKWPKMARWSFYIAMSIVILKFIALESDAPSEFIYFKF